MAREARNCSRSEPDSFQKECNDRYILFVCERVMGQGRATEAMCEGWRAACRWRRAVEAVLSEAGLKFTEWLVLEATHRSIVQTKDAVSQNHVARALELDRMTLSAAMRRLERRGLVDRGPTFQCHAWRVFVTHKGVALLRDLQPRIEAVSHAHC